MRLINWIGKSIQCMLLHSANNRANNVISSSTNFQSQYNSFRRREYITNDPKIIHCSSKIHTVMIDLHPIRSKNEIRIFIVVERKFQQNYTISHSSVRFSIFTTTFIIFFFFMQIKETIIRDGSSLIRVANIKWHEFMNKPFKIQNYIYSKI